MRLDRRCLKAALSCMPQSMQGSIVNPIYLSLLQDTDDRHQAVPQSGTELHAPEHGGDELSTRSVSLLQDTDDMDQAVPQSITELGNCLMQLLSTLIFISVIQPIFLAGMVPLMVLYYFLQM